MKFDFTLNVYVELLKTLQSQGFLFQTLEEFLIKPDEKVIVMRHDVDLLPENALKMAVIEQQMGIQASYYFRVVPESFNPEIIKRISGMVHEIGYHYEDLTRAKGDHDLAYQLFCQNLESFRALFPVKTICMHGSPMSRYDSRNIWKKYDYKSLGIIGEPYFDIDFSKVLYLTDTGRRWDGEKVSVRDKSLSTETKPLKLDSVKTIFDIIQKAKFGQLPDKIMINIHPQRWTNNPYLWTKELVMQNMKNGIKRMIVLRNLK